jgi:hypothetical protein
MTKHHDLTIYDFCPVDSTNERAIQIAGIGFCEYVNTSPAERARRDALIAEFIPSDDEIAAGLPKLVPRLDDDKPAGEHVDPEHDIDALLDELDADAIVATIDPELGIIETPIVEHPEQHVDSARVTEAELRSVMAEIEAGDTGEHAAFERDADDMSPARRHWHHAKNRMNDEPHKIVEGIRRTAPQYADPAEKFFIKRNSAKSQERTFSRDAGYALGGRKRKEIWAKKSPPELRAERRREMDRLRQQRHRAAKRAETS